MAIKRYMGALVLLLSGCTMGPDFTPPAVVAPTHWLSGKPAATPSRPVEKPVAAQWWRILHDPLLDTLVARVAKENPDMLTAATRLEESRAELSITSAGLYPQASGSGSYTREKQSDKGVITLFGGGASGGQPNGIPSSRATPPFNIYQYGFDASWEIDLWGRGRRGIEAAEADVQAAAEAQRGVEVSTIAELVSDYAQLRGTQASLVTAEENLKGAEEIARLVDNRARHGLSSSADTANAGAEVAAAQAQLPPLKQQEAQLKNAIALLLGQPPGGLDAALEAPEALPPLPPGAPVGLPSALVRRRPDIRQAEAKLHAAVAQIGAARADFFPQVTLLGSGALQALNFSDLNTWAARMYSFGPSVSLPIFEGGRLVSTLKLRTAQEREAAIAYRKTVLAAFHEVDDALTGYRFEQEHWQALKSATAQDSEAVTLAKARYAQGLASFIDVLAAEQKLLAARLQETRSAEAALVDMVQLYKALGGGWQQDFPAAA